MLCQPDVRRSSRAPAWPAHASGAHLLVEPDARISVFFSLRLTVSYMSWNVATFVHLGLRFRFYSGAGRLAPCFQDVSAMLFLPLYKTPRLP